MPDKLTFPFPVSLLVQEAELILNAADAATAQISPRLPQGHVAGARALAEEVSQLDTKQKSDAGELGTLTADQNAKLAALQEQLGRARETGKRAYKGNDVKLREEFQVGINKPSDLASILQRAKIVLASLQKSGNAAALQSKGWLAADTAALEAAIEALDSTDETQESAKNTKTGSTGQRNAKANELYEGLLTIQNAANLQWPERQPGNAAIRAGFRLGKFPPRTGGGKKPDVPKPPTPPA
jgi:hypothetical protein